MLSQHTEIRILNSKENSVTVRLYGAEACLMNRDITKNGQTFKQQSKENSKNSLVR